MRGRDPITSGAIGRYAVPQLFQAAGYHRGHIPLDWRVQTLEYESIIGPGSAQGRYVPIRVGIKICELYGPKDLVPILKKMFPLEKGEVDIKQTKRRDDFEMFKAGDHILSIRKRDWYVNLAHICSAAQVRRQELQKEEPEGSATPTCQNYLSRARPCAVRLPPFNFE
ncbi:uncharacterized protein PV06_11711 [Exophiala oligosperma]|uniref:Uncharacterized protein n=1 Tax=Exophiala oligosperma TaxID=215243 RepID=A0A0D2A6P6_9EURO|nr:uncharacterized protein PV06_11711 [Exophiala oligosperma]KIW35991.1 hypothetical protein PV06_11711 [Exophiala oligosperma]